MSKQKEKNKASLSAAAAGILGSHAPKNLLGYEKVYHGTSTSGARGIRESGIRKAKAGTGIGANDVQIGHAKAKDIRGKVFTTRNKFLADAHQPGFGNHKMGETVKARMPYRAKGRLAEDTVLKNISEGKIGKEIPGSQQGAKRHLKDLRIYKHDVKSRFIEGGKDYGGRRQFATKGNMRRYLSQAGGKARFAKGVAQAAGATGSALYSVAHALKARKEKD